MSHIEIVKNKQTNKTKKTPGREPENNNKNKQKNPLPRQEWLKNTADFSSESMQVRT